MSRVIQDSDDEGGLSDASPPKPLNEARMAMVPPPTDNLAAPIAISMNGTSSSGMIFSACQHYPQMLIEGTERLRREIDQAHNAMFEPSPSAGSKRSHPDLYTSATSPSKLKRSKTATGSERESPSMHTPGEKSRLKRTYSKKPTRETPEGDIFEFKGGDESPVTTKNKLNKSGRKPSQLDVAAPLVDVYQAAGQTVNPLDTLNQKPLDPSPLHSSAFISPTSDPYSHMFGTPSQQLPAGHMMGTGFETHEPNVMFPEMSSTVAASSSSLEKRMTPRTTTTAAPGHQSQEKIVLEKEIDEVRVARLSEVSMNSSKQADGHIQTLTADAQLNYTNTQPQDNMPESVRQQQRKRKADVEPAGPDLNSETWVGLPKENYKPRPSRSRSALPSQADPLVSLESLSSNRSKKLRRSRTGGSAIGGMSNETTQKLVEMGFTAADSEAALIGNDWVFERALETLIARGASRSKSPEVVRSKGQVTEDHKVVKEPGFENEGTVVIYTSPIRGDADQAASRISKIQHEEALEQADDARDLNGNKVSTNDDSNRSIVPAGQDQNDEVQAAEQAQTPSDTKIKRTKSTKSRNKPKKLATAVEAGLLNDKGLQSTLLSTAKEQSPATNEEHNKDKLLVTIQKTAEDGDKSTQEKPTQLKPEAEDKSTTASRLELGISKLPQDKPSQASTNEIIEIEDDSDGPPVVSKKLRRTKTAPAAALKKEKKTKKRQPKKSEQPISEEKVSEEDLDEPKDNAGGSREALQKIDGNAAVLVNDEPANEVVEDVVSAKSKKADTKATKRAKAAAKSAKTIRDTPEIDEEEEDQTQIVTDDTTSEPPKAVSKAAKKTPEPTKPADDIRNEHDDASRQTAETESKKGEKKPHSPIKRVTYRVGLSKRTRIEPLLKMRR